MSQPIKRARALADSIRAAWPEKAAEIDRMIAEVESGQRAESGLKLGIRTRYRLEKFDGPITPGKQPSEVIEGEDQL